MLLAFGPEDLERLAVPIGVAVFLLTFLVVAFARRKQAAEGYSKGQEARKRHPILARVADVVGVLLLIGLALWFFFWRK
jgi:hypothetical protein